MNAQNQEHLDYSTDNRVPIGGITDIEGAKQVALRLFQQYDKTNSGEINTTQISEMMKDTYKDMGKGFNPSKADTDTFFGVLDINKNGRVTLKELEALAIKYLVGVNPN